MHILQSHQTNDILMVPSTGDALVGQTIFHDCFALSSTEPVLILADSEKCAEAQLLFELAKRHTTAVKLTFFTGMTENGQEPSAQMIECLVKHPVSLLVTHYSLTHTRGIQTAIDQGARIASMPGITIPMMHRCLAADYQQLRKLSRNLALALTNSSSITIDTTGGTHLTASLEHRKGESDDGDFSQKGTLGNLPAGEAFIAPIEESVSGTLVIDGALADIALDSPISIEIKNGQAINVTGQKAARTLLAAMEAVGPAASIVAEIGIGTNKKAILDSDVLESEKVYATCHVAFGDNMDFGGRNEAPFHSDGVVLEPSIKLDGKVILEAGKFNLDY